MTARTRNTVMNISLSPTTSVPVNSPVIEVQDFERRQHRYTATSFSSSIPNNCSSQSHISNLTLSELKFIESELKGLVLNPSDEDDVDCDNLNETELNAELTEIEVEPELHALTETEDFGFNGLASVNAGCVLGSGLTCSASGDSGVGVAGSTTQNVSYKLSEGTAISTTTSYSTPNLLRIELKDTKLIKDFSSLNRSDMSELKLNEDRLDICQRNYLSFIRNKVKCFPHRFPDQQNYLRQSSLFVLTHGWTSADRFCRCCIPNKKNLSGECRLHRFCSYCSWRAGQSASLRYVPAFEDGTWHFLTGSYTGDLTMKGPTDAHDWLDYWDAYKLALNQLVKDGDLRGVYMTEELAVNSMLPVQVLPHIHCIIEASAITRDTVAKLKHLVTQHLYSRFDQPLTPNIKVDAIKTQRSLFHHLRYMFKPINVVKAYDLAWAKALHNNRKLAQSLNSQTTDLVLGYAHVTTDRQKMHAKGNLDSRSKNFIGVRKKNHEVHRETLKELMEQPFEYIEMNEPETIVTGQP